MEKQSKEQLAEQHPDAIWRRRLLRLAYLSDLLGSSIIFNDYRVSDRLASAISLSSEGGRVLSEAVQKKKIPAKDAKLMALLELAHRELLIDVDTIDIEELEAAISEQVRDKKIHFAPVLGRLLYDRAAELFEDVEEYLTVSQTSSLLEGAPQGVAQFGPYLIGPRGLLVLEFARLFNANRYAVPLFSCSDHSCSRVHTAALSTDWDAPINEHRTTFRKIVEREGKEPSDWPGFINDLDSPEHVLFDDLSTATLPYALGDCLSEQELRDLLRYELDSENAGQVRGQLAHLGLKNAGSAVSVTSAPTHYELLQFYLARPDSEVLTLIDEAIYNGALTLPPGETRRPIVSRDKLSSGAYGAQLELSALGYRVATQNLIGPQRLSRLVHSIFDDPGSDRFVLEDELEWFLRDVEGATVRGRLEDYLRSGNPADILRTLVLSKRAHVVIACHRLGIDDSIRPDRELLSRMLWKLGFDVPNIDLARDNFWRLHERVEQSARTATSSGFANYEALRAQCGAYFPELERVLLDCLLYSTWALMHDHYSAERPFTYLPDSHRSWAMTELNAQYTIEHRGDDETPMPPYAEDEVTLGPMIDGFRLLALRLQAIQVAANELMRPDSQVPDFVKYSDLQAFPFLHIKPFLDLREASQLRLIQLFLDAARDLSAAEVAGVRNEQAHYRRQRSPASMTRLENAMAVTRRVVSGLESAGLVRLEFRRVQVQSDEWGRSTHLLADETGREFALTRPSEFAWVRLPAPRTPQYVVQEATFREPNEVLRFRVQATSEYSALWEHFPRRRRKRAPIAPMPARQEARASTQESG